MNAPRKLAYKSLRRTLDCYRYGYARTDRKHSATRTFWRDEFHKRMKAFHGLMETSHTEERSMTVLRRYFPLFQELEALAASRMHRR